MTSAVFIQGKSTYCRGCGRQLRSNNTVGYCQQTVECRRVYKRIQSAKLRALSLVDHECQNCGSRIRSDNRSGYCNAPDCHRIWERVRSQLRRTDNPEHYRTYSREYKRSHRAQTALISAKRRARKCGVPFNLTIDDLPPIPDICPVLGVPLVCGEGRIVPESLSLDRIDPALGYVRGNVMWLSNRANSMKQDASLEQLQQFARWALTLR
jgi:hypothetical protein